jgi:ubiquinone/menaquinone biosynthesis C-methylase UbiE
MGSAELVANEVDMANTGEMTSLFEKNYINLRKYENRVYTDSELARLPDIDSSHIHYKEWQTRKQSCRKLIAYLKDKRKAPDILEIGCGNGWLSNQLSKIPGSCVTGLDINITELRQAEQVFSGGPNLQFVSGDLCSGALNDMRFDFIVFAASIQYFPSLSESLHYALSHLKRKGEVHIIDTPFYTEKQLLGANQRTADYYLSLGLPEMKDYYFHHSLQELQSFNFRFLYNPSLLRNRFFRNSNPFPWICISDKMTEG